jgi:membrane-bound metal-dependent hydrolase YbcI (DUF457 family)
MYVGHFGAGLALKAARPKAPTWGILLGVGLLDILFGPFVLLGIEHATVTPGGSPGFTLDYIDWSHSLVMAIVWSVLFALAFLKKGKSVATVMGVAVFSHYLLDLPMHPPDMALWPNSSIHLGFGLWNRLPTGWWFVELVVIAAGWAYYVARGRRDRTFAGRPTAVGITLLALHLFNSPWFSSL